MVADSALFSLHRPLSPQIRRPVWHTCLGGGFRLDELPLLTSLSISNSRLRSSAPGNNTPTRAETRGRCCLQEAQVHDALPYRR